MEMKKMKKYKVQVQRVTYFDEEVEIEVEDDATDEEIAETAEIYARENVEFTDETGADYVIGDYEEIVS